MIVCNHCGNVMEQNTRFCVECGHESATSITSSLPSAAVPAPVTQTQDRQSETFSVGAPSRDGSRSVLPGVLAPINRKPIVIGAAIGGALFFLAVGGIAAWFLFERNSPTGVANQTPVTADSSRPATNPQPASQQLQTPPPSRGAKANSSAARDEVIGVLNDWAAAVRAHDLGQHLSYYADVLNVYYRKQNVSLDYVRSSRKPAFTRFTKLDVQLAKIVVNIDPSGDLATATFDKTYRFEGDKILSGSVQQMISLTRIDNRWRITGEQDLQIYHIDK